MSGVMCASLCLGGVRGVSCCAHLSATEAGTENKNTNKTGNYPLGNEEQWLKHTSSQWSGAGVVSLN